MTATIHRYLITISGILTGLGALIAVPDFEPLGIPATIGIGAILLGSALSLIATKIRDNFDPQV